MALGTAKVAATVFYQTGTPSSDTEYDKLDFKVLRTRARSIKIEVTGAAVDISFDGTDDQGSLPVGIHEFRAIEAPQLFVRKIAATIQVWAWGSNA